MANSSESHTPRVILDESAGYERVYANPVRAISANLVEEVTGALADIDRAVAGGRHVAGYLSYELGYALERRLIPLVPPQRKVPLLRVGIFETCKIVSAQNWTGRPRTHASPLVDEWTSDAHRAAFDHVHALIDAGDLYQANISYRAAFAFAGNPYAFYRQLKMRSGAHHCAFVDDGERQMVSISPELFFAIDKRGRITVRPMKGTASRGATAGADRDAIAALLASEKERAENLMIVDLLRNDLSKIAKPGSVHTDSLFDVESFPTLHQMVSTVSAALPIRRAPSDIVRALFPCGSVTGAPKIRAMEVIREVETSPRGVYCGAIGHFSPDGSARFNVAIRTLTISGGRGELGIGGAIVHDSRAAAEFDECRLKARFFETIRQPIQLIETMRYVPREGLTRGARHLVRMKNSANALGFPYDSEAAHAALDASVRNLIEEARVRLVLDESGEFRVAVEPLAASPSLWRYAISGQRVDSFDALARHKTSRREFYDREQARMAAATGCDEVLFLNEKNELTEGSRSNIFIERDGQMFTPHTDCGLLDGCLRRELLDRGHCSEAHLGCADLETADRIFLGNSLRGLIPATPMSAAGTPLSRRLKHRSEFAQTCE